MFCYLYHLVAPRMAQQKSSCIDSIIILFPHYRGKKVRHSQLIKDETKRLTLVFVPLLQNVLTVIRSPIWLLNLDVYSFKTPCVADWSFSLSWQVVLASAVDRHIFDRRPKPRKAKTREKRISGTQHHSIWPLINHRTIFKPIRSNCYSGDLMDWHVKISVLKRLFFILHIPAQRNSE